MLVMLQYEKLKFKKVDVSKLYKLLIVRNETKDVGVTPVRVQQVEVIKEERFNKVECIALEIEKFEEVKLSNKVNLVFCKP